MRESEIPEISSEEVEKLCRVAEVRRILMSIKAALPPAERHCIAVTSSNPREGKTLLSALLSSAVSDCEDKKVLAVDLNWRNPGLDRLFNLKRDFSLNTYFEGSNPLEVVQTTRCGRVDLLSAPSGAQLEGWDNFSVLALSVVERIKDLYDFVVVDTPSVFPTNRNMVDPVLISTACDGVILTLLAAATPRSIIRSATVNLEISGARVLGVVMNHWKNLKHSCRA